jgi:hypothetical protein
LNKWFGTYIRNLSFHVLHNTKHKLGIASSDGGAGLGRGGGDGVVVFGHFAIKRQQPYSFDIALPIPKYDIP